MLFGLDSLVFVTMLHGPVTIVASDAYIVSSINERNFN